MCSKSIQLSEAFDDLIVNDVQIVTPGAVIARDQSLAITAGRIAWIGPREAANNRAARRRIEGGGGLCLPGLINSHNHTPLMAVRGMVEDLGFAPAYTPNVPQGHWLSDEETLALARLGALELLTAGATTIVDYYRKPDALARAAEELGIRAFIGGRVMDADSLALSEGRFVRDEALGEATLADADALHSRWDGAAGGRIRTIHAPHAPDTCSKALLRQIADLAGRDGRAVHTHLAQSPLEIAQVRARDGVGSVDVLDEAGLLGPSLVAAHCIFLDPAEIRRLGAARIVVAHAPIGNAAFGAAAPIEDLAEAGAQITLCTDTKSADLFEAMRMAIAAARWRSGGRFVFDAHTVFAWATSQAADALCAHAPDPGPQGDAAGLGRVAVGAPADLVLLDPQAPNLRPVIDGAGIIAHSGAGANVRWAICDGEVLLENGAPARVDAAAIVAEAQTVAEGLWRRAGRL